MRYTKTGRKSHKNKDSGSYRDHDKKHSDRRGRADCCKRIRSDQFSHDHRIHQIVKLLEQITENHRDGKRKHAFDRASLRHAAFRSIITHKFHLINHQILYQP